LERKYLDISSIKKPAIYNGRAFQLSHFDSLSTLCEDDSFVPPGYPDFTFSVTCIFKFIYKINSAQGLYKIFLSFLGLLDDGLALTRSFPLNANNQLNARPLPLVHVGGDTVLLKCLRRYHHEFSD